MNIDYFILVADAGVLILFLAVFFENKNNFCFIGCAVVNFDCFAALLGAGFRTENILFLTSFFLIYSVSEKNLLVATFARHLYSVFVINRKIAYAES